MGFTLRKDERILKSVEFRRVLRLGRRFRTSRMTVVALARATGKVRLGLTVSRKIGNAVVRNRVKRLLREIVRHERQRLSRGWELVFIAQPAAAVASLQELMTEVVPVLEELVRLEAVQASRSSVVREDGGSRSSAPRRTGLSE